MLAGNFVTKVIYLPDPEFQELALAGVETLVSTRLDPGVDPIVEADRRGSILAVVRLGNKDVELAGGEEGLGFGGGFGGGCGGGIARCLRRLGRMGALRRPAAELCRRRHRAAVRHALCRHADRPAWPAAHSAGRPGRLAEAHDEEPHAHAHPGSDASNVEDSRPPAAGPELSEAGEPGLDPRADDPPEPAVRAAALGHARADSAAECRPGITAATTATTAGTARRAGGYCPPDQMRY